ncbi:Cirhin [Galdieria sulphuraria]|uniref:Transducin-related protein / WD-40 repeat protein-related protein n=1 Tax=Galdieria sulphuraria TaxID=130081 RepID=M2Y893_GALSU|nr:transducin-related protein / WD-40 repeat protein-related protein [Galdieria sulphuraria]EME32059.1 transducin-related protein / WD-40 repeat protein-related protein [Galdieria sulphuraria]GJD06704.1 Cirhin [Galdieria sulphuraria]|eukprot:XP_005708579.1 transducin-related protein / WD-40 repeat protein-related protein [Galdieria sulphuraria]
MAKDSDRNENQSAYVSSKQQTFQIALHRCSFVNFETSAVVAICPDCSHSGNQFFVARENGDLETRSAFTGWAVQNYVPSTIKTGKFITSIVELAVDKVMTSTLDGFLTIWDMERRTQLYQQSPGGGAIWCMEVDPTTTNDTKTIAIGCEDGRVRLIHIATSQLADATNSKDLVQVELLEAGQSRVLAIAWSLESTSFLLATDDSGNIRKLDTETRRCVQVMKITQQGVPAVIWSVIALKVNSNHHYYATGDSRGILTIWDATTCSVISEFAVENCKGDITCLTGIVHEDSQDPNLALPDVDILFGASDGGIGAIRGHWTSTEPNKYHWIPVRGRSLHARDVRTIKAIGNHRIVAGGADCRISIIDTNDFFSEAPCIRLYPSRQPHRPSCASYYRNKDLLVAEHDQHVDFWKGNCKMMDKILFRYKSRKRDGHICASAVSEDFTWFAVATTTVIRIYQVSWVENGTVAMEVDPFQVIHSCGGARQLLWIYESNTCSYLLALSKEAECIFLHTILSNQNAASIEKPRSIQWADWIPTKVSKNASNSCTITCMTHAKESTNASEMSLFFAAGDKYGNVFIFDIRHLDSPVASLQGCLSESVVSIRFQKNVLIVCGCRGQIQLFRIEADSGKWKMDRLSSWSEKSMEWVKEQLILSLNLLPIYGLDIDVDSSCFLIYGRHYIILLHWEQFEEVINKGNHLEDSMDLSETGKPSQDSSSERHSTIAKKIQKVPTKKLKIMYPLENVVYACFMSDQEKKQTTDNMISILCLEHRWEDMLSHMPPAVLKKKFGI